MQTITLAITYSEYNVLVASVLLKVEELQKLLKKPKDYQSVRDLRAKLASTQALLDKLRKEQDCV